MKKREEEKKSKKEEEEEEESGEKRGIFVSLLVDAQRMLNV